MSSKIRSTSSRNRNYITSITHCSNNLTTTNYIPYIYSNIFQMHINSIIIIFIMPNYNIITTSTITR